MLRKLNIVVFDFDGTISAHDANFEFAKYCYRHSIRPWLFIPCFILAVLTCVFKPGGVWWRQVRRLYLTSDMVKKFAPIVIKQHKRNRFGWVKSQIEKEKSKGNTVVLISASPDFLIQQLVKDLHFDAVLSSEMDENTPWRYKFVCWGKNKVIALDNWAKNNKIIPNVIKSYSDSISDMPMMNIAKEQVWINSKTGMRK
ncbi:MAG: haloacid dehalogenase-like hydrolase [Alphaproteobacteria bacterium]|nr:haloacid dehalogenase-like hydrolase [Alphaproteobacteria bacterium]